MVAVASHRLGRIPEATDLLRRGVRHAKSLAVLDPFTRMPRRELLEIAESVPEVRAFIDDDRILRATRTIAPEVRLVTLSEREQLVLERLSENLPAGENRRQPERVDQHRSHPTTQHLPEAPRDITARSIGRRDRSGVDQATQSPMTGRTSRIAGGRPDEA